MCTVVLRVPEQPSDPIRLLAVRDEDPARPWRPLGAWWPQHPQVTGIQDELAGGAWLAYRHNRLAVLLNRAGGASVPQPTSRGALVLGAVTGAPLPQPLTTLGFNLVEASPAGVRVTSWEGDEVQHHELSPGTHMIAHEDPDDPASPRIAAWLGRFTQASATSEPWWRSWLAVLAESAHLPPTDERAIIRDNRAHGLPTLSLAVCCASISPAGVSAELATLDPPGQWRYPQLSGSALG